MDLQNLKDNHSILLSYMKAQNYSKHYVWAIKREIKWILNESRHYHWKTYDDIYQTYVEKWKNKVVLTDKRIKLSVIKRFDQKSIMPDRLRHYRSPSNYDFLCVEFKSFINTYRKIVELDSSGSYQKDVERVACSFLMALQKKSIISFDLVTEESVLDVFLCNGIISKSYSFKYALEVAFKTCNPAYPDNRCSKIISYLPALQKIKKNIQYLSKTEILKIKTTLDNDPSIPLRNKSICLLALYTGLRSSDIATLTFDAIDWTNDLIHIKQNKTGHALTLPLRAVVGNALFEYLTKERPKSSEKFIFSTLTPPYRRIQTSSLYGICISIMNKAGVRTAPNDRRGFHLFRHYVATSLLENGIEQPIISATLGHQSPQSLNSYLSADFCHLKECALSINLFPYRKEMFQL
ncbi:tyrosine-type recombinase/integrase [Dysgonomonas sp. ZJ709]|uniref:tyrosine-type recombinase/integrase n=1 Tax=Dysgonomonas sp. ZJ709 TaxID=2709797 RepID=UPI0013EDF5A3|nr:tyrosine-type recombinase/integrase [Dysgonomonas sp. ZJ709]